MKTYIVKEKKYYSQKQECYESGNNSNRYIYNNLQHRVRLCNF